MGVGNSLGDLGRFLDRCEEGPADGVELAGPIDPDGGGLTADVELTVSVPTGEGVSLRSATVDDDGTLRLAMESTDPVVPTGDEDVGVDVTDATVSPDGPVTVALSASVREGPNAGSGQNRRDDASAVVGDDGEETADAARDRGVPPFRDPELLAEVYESCDTFAEMTEALEMDVTAETVRRYMVDHGIHEPNSYDTGDDPDEDAQVAADEESRSRVVLADGIGLPDDVTVDTLVETVKDSNTIYEVERDIGVDRADALDMLRELNLLDLVVGRLATEAERDIDREEVVERLRESSAAQAG